MARVAEGKRVAKASRVVRVAGDFNAKTAKGVRFTCAVFSFINLSF